MYSEYGVWLQRFTGVVEKVYKNQYNQTIVVVDGREIWFSDIETVRPY